MKSKTAEYKIWKGMKYRCSRDLPRHRWYHGNGISVCERWLNFDNFLLDMGTRPSGTSIDRIDNNGNYEPGNCKWSSLLEQGYSRRAWSSTGRKGVTKRKSGRYESKIKYNNSIHIFLGSYLDLDIAAQAFDTASWILYRDTRSLNFPEKADEYEQLRLSGDAKMVLRAREAFCRAGIQEAQVTASQRPDT